MLHLNALSVLRRPAITQHMDAIAKELTKDLGSRLWRVREASCHALSALVQVCAPVHMPAQKGVPLSHSALWQQLDLLPVPTGNLAIWLHRSGQTELRQVYMPAQGQRWDAVESNFESFWTMTFRVLDDVKVQLPQLVRAAHLPCLA